MSSPADSSNRSSSLSTMQTSPEPDSSQRLLMLRATKNAIIGDKRAKLDLVSSHKYIEIQAIFNGGPDVEIDHQIEAAEVLALIANDEPEVSRILVSTIPLVETTLNVIASTASRQLQLRCLQLLTAVFGSGSVPSDQTLLVATLDNLLSSLPNLDARQLPLDQRIVAEIASLVVLLRGSAPAVGQTPSHALGQVGHTLFDRLFKCLNVVKNSTNVQTVSYPPKLVQLLIEACICTLSPGFFHKVGLGVVDDSTQLACGYLCESIVSSPATQRLLQLSRSETPGLRLSAVELLCHINNASSLPFPTFYTSPCIQETPSNDMDNWQVLIQVLMPLITPLVTADSPYLARLGNVIALMVRDDEKSARMLLENGLVTTIVQIMSEHVATRSSLGPVESFSFVLAGIASHSDELRGLVNSTQVIENTVAVIKLPKESPQIERAKIASCQLLRVLTRSITLLRTCTAFEEVTRTIAEPLITSGERSNPEIQAAAMAVVANLILEFSPSRKLLFELGIIETIIQALESNHYLLRLNALWALKHASFEAPEFVKANLMRSLGINRIMALCNDSNVVIQAQALAFLRNYTCDYLDGVDFCLAEIGPDDLFGMLRNKLTDRDTMLQAVYVLVHIAAGTDEHREAILKQVDLLKDILVAVKTVDPDILLGTIWLVRNLAWRGNELQQQAARHAEFEIRARKLTDLGYREFLAECVDGPSKVSERASVALNELGPA